MTPQSMSYVSGASERPLLGLTIGAQLEPDGRPFPPDNEALVVPHQDVRWRYGAFTEQVAEFAAGLLALGLERGDRIGIWSPNNSEWAVTQFAAAKAGLILVNIKPRLPPRRAGVRAQQGGVSGAGDRRIVQVEPLYRDAAPARTGARQCPPPAC